MSRWTWRELLRDYGQALVQAPQLIRRLAFKTRTLEEERQEARRGRQRAAAAAAARSGQWGWAGGGGLASPRRPPHVASGTGRPPLEWAARLRSRPPAACARSNRSRSCAALCPAGRAGDAVLRCAPLQAVLRGNLRKEFGKFGLLMLGLGIVIGSGVFALTGQTALLVSG